MIRSFENLQEYLSFLQIDPYTSDEHFAAFDIDQTPFCLSENFSQSYRLNFFELTLIVESSCSFLIDSFDFKQEDSSLVIVSPNRLQSVLNMNTMGGQVGYSLFLSKEFMLQSLMPTAVTSNPLLTSSFYPVQKLPHKALSELVQVFRLIKYEHEEYGAASADIIKSLVNVVLQKAKAVTTQNLAA